MLWLRQDGDFVATSARGRYTVYRAGGRAYAASFKPHGTHVRTRDIGVVGSIGEAKGLAERHALMATHTAAYASCASRTSRGSRSNFVPQVILFDRKLYTELEARRWVKKHGYEALKVTTEHGKVRVRQRDPRSIIPGTWATVKFGKGITAVFGRVASSRALSRAA